jgi:arylsulfatase A-like enzyme
VIIGNSVARSTDVHAAVKVWLDQAADQQPFLLYVHAVDPHLPYAPPEPFRSLFAPEVRDPDLGSAENADALASDPGRVTPELMGQLSELYDAEVAANDASFGLLLEELNRRGLESNTVVIMISDHGEELWEHHGLSHGNTLHAEVLNIPLIMRIPGVARRRVPDIVQHVDVFATMLALGGIKPMNEGIGRSLLPLASGEARGEWTERAVAHLHLKERFSLAYVEPEWKLIIRRLRNGNMLTTLYQREVDPLEQNDLAPMRSEIVDQLRERLRQEQERGGPPLEAAVASEDHEAEIVEQLRALGYV